MHFIPQRTAAAAAAVLAIVAGAAFAQEVEVVKIGHAAPLSGPQAHDGRDSENGVRMALADLNAKNLVIGGKKIRFELVSEDDAADPAQAAAVAHRLCDAQVAGVVGHLNSGATLAAAPVYHDCRIPHITGAASDPSLTQPGYDTTYRITANDNAQGAGLAFYAATALKLKKIAIIDDGTPYGQSLTQVFKKIAQENGLAVVDEQSIAEHATDFTALLHTLKAKAPDAIFYGGMDPQAGAMLRQLRRQGLGNVRFLGGGGICTPQLPQLAGGARAVDHVICAQGGASITKMPGGSAWKARYDAKFPHQFQIYSPYTYDAAFVLADAMKRADSTDPQRYLLELPRTHYQGVTATITFESNGELKNPTMTIFTFKNGRKVALN